VSPAVSIDIAVSPAATVAVAAQLVWLATSVTCCTSFPAVIAEPPLSPYLNFQSL